MTWLSKLFSKNSDKISVSKKDATTSNKNQKRSNSTRTRRGSIVMRQKMQKKIAESAKEKVLDRKRKSQSVLEFKFNDNTDNVDNIRVDFNENILIKNDQHLNHQINHLNNGYEKQSKSPNEKTSIKQEEDDQCTNSELINEKSDTGASSCKISTKKQIYLEQPELFSYRSLHSPTGLKSQETKENNFNNQKIDKQDDKMSVDQMRYTTNHHQQTPIHKTMSEDNCAINELIEGRMDLQVIVPFYLIKNQKSNSSTFVVLINVERKTPILDLLVQIGNKVKFNVNDYKIVIDELRNYKANTPIGSLDVNQIQIVPKTTAAINLHKDKLRELELINLNQQKSISTINKLVQISNLKNQINNSNGSLNNSKPFQTTFRLQVNLPFNQRTVYRVTPTNKIIDVKKQICYDKDLNIDKYQLIIYADLKHKQHPQILEDERTLAFYAINEVTLISNKDLEKKQRQNEFNGLNGQNDTIITNNSNLKSIVNSQSTAASVPRKAIISLLSTTNQLVADCDYSNNICTKNKCVCNLSSSNFNINNCQKKLYAKSDSSSNLNRINRRKKNPAPPPPGTNKENNLRRSHSNHSLMVGDKLSSATTSNKQITKIRHNSGSDSSGYHECLSSANSPNNHQFGGSMINLSNNSLSVSPILHKQSLVTSTPSSKQQFRSTQNLNYKKRRAPQPPTGLQKSPIIEQKSIEQSSPSLDLNKENKNVDIEVITTKEHNQLKNSPSNASYIQSNQSEIERKNNHLNLELKKDDYSNDSIKAKINNNNLIKSVTSKSNSFKSDSSGHSSGHSSSNSPELNDKDEIGSSASSNCENSLEVDDEIDREENRKLNRSQNNVNNKEIKLSKLVKESLENRLLNTKSPTSVASEPSYSSRTYFNNQSEAASESTNSIVMLNLDEVRPSSAPNYCEEDHIDNSKHQQKAHNEIQLQNENSKDSGIFLKDKDITINVKQQLSNSIDIKKEEKILDKKDEKLNLKEEAADEKENSNNITTLIINVNDKSNNYREDIKSISTLIEDGDLIIKDEHDRSAKNVINQANCSTFNIAPVNCALKEETIVSEKAKDEDEKSIKNEQISNESKSRISDFKEQLEQQSAISVNNRPKIKLKLNNFKIGSYSTSQTDEDIYNDNKTIYLPPYQTNLLSKSTVDLINQEETIRVNENEEKNNNLKIELSNNNETTTKVTIEREDSFKKPNIPIKKLNLDNIKFKEVPLDVGLSGNKLNNINNAIKETNKFNLEEFNDQEFNSLYVNDNYQPERPLPTLSIINNLSMITPQPYKNTRTIVPRKLFYNTGNDIKLNQLNQDVHKNNEIPLPPALPNSDNSDNTNKRSLFRINSSNSFKENKLKSTSSYLVSDRKSIQLDNVDTFQTPIKNKSDCHTNLMDEIRTFGGRNSLKKVSKRTEEFEINF